MTRSRTLCILYKFNLCFVLIFKVLSYFFFYFSWSKCQLFHHELELKTNAVLVICQNQAGEQVYKNTHHVITRKEVHAKLTKQSLPKRPLSVLFVVIDSISRLNFIRTMPKSRDYVSENGFIEMRGYNKIDDNTFPNFLALLTGLNKPQLRKIHCNGRELDELDKCPMIWYNFSSAGYVTAYGEDWAKLGTFNYYKKGFTKPPTDFYFRPYVLASEAVGTLLLRGAPYCAGPESSGERQLDLALDFAKTFKNSPYFGIFWMNTFSHQGLNIPHSFDDKLREFFTNLKAEGVLDDSMVILLSDHGMRMDQTIRRTVAGWFEERLPMNFISIPKWFKEKYPNSIDNLMNNNDKLTSTYDLYMTLQQILSMSKRDFNITPSSACPKCVSLFDKIPVRTCSEAGIPQEWCTCIGHMTYLNQSDPLVLDGIQFVLDHIKSELNFNKYSQVCHEYQSFEVKKAALSETSEYEDIKYLFIHFLAYPHAEFIATLKYGSNVEHQQKRFNLLLDVIRLDRGDSSCIPLSTISHYCNCIKRPNSIQ